MRGMHLTEPEHVAIPQHVNILEHAQRTVVVLAALELLISALQQHVKHAPDRA